MIIRPATDSDASALIALIAGVFAEYEGCRFVLDELPELRAIASHFRDQDGAFWVAESVNEVLGCVGFSPKSKARVELHKLYVRADARRHGLGSTLCDRVETSARALGAGSVELWTDTKFATAHRFYERRGYVKDDRSRLLHDLSNTEEFHYQKQI